MVFLEIPKQLTEEEKLLQQKYAKLRKKKKLLQQMKTPKLEKPASNTPVPKKESCKQDAKEVAKKLLKQGSIILNKPDKDKKDAGFRKPKAAERKRIGADKPAGFKPFQPKKPYESDGTSPTPDSGDDQYKPLYHSYNNPAEEPEEFREPKRRRTQFSPSKGCTVYVHGIGLTVESLRNSFSTFGSVININNQSSKNCAFVTFETSDQAATAIKEMDGKHLDGAFLKVSVARRQAHNRDNDGSGGRNSQSTNVIPPSWGGFNSKQDFVDEREVVSCDDLEAMF